MREVTISSRLFINDPSILFQILEDELCRKEAALARQYGVLGSQTVLPVCKDLPALGSPESANCVRLGISQVSQLIQPHSCYSLSGREYRGSVSTTKSGLICLPWTKKSSTIGSTSAHVELIGGHNFCRNPSIKGKTFLVWVSHKHIILKKKLL